MHRNALLLAPSLSGRYPSPGHDVSGHIQTTLRQSLPAPAISHGVRDIIFQTGGQIYSIVAFGGATPEQLANVEPAVLSLASTIVNKQD